MDGSSDRDAPATVRVRSATPDDVAAITRIFNASIPATTVVWTDEPNSVEYRRQWFDERQRLGLPVLVATDGDDVVGFASYGDFRDSVRLPGYRFTVEHTVHVAESHWGSGSGRALMVELIDHATRAGVHVMIGGIDGANDGSYRFHRRLGFVEVARMPEVGFKFGRWLDLILMQRILGDREGRPADGPGSR